MNVSGQEIVQQKVRRAVTVNASRRSGRISRFGSYGIAGGICRGLDIRRGDLWPEYYW